MKKRPLTPSKLRLALSGALVLIIAVSCGIFYFAYQQLDKKAESVGAKVAESNDSQNLLQQLRKTEQDLEKNKELAEKVSMLAANGQDFAYQDQIVNDLTVYAERSGMTINNITFSAADGSTGTPQPTEAATTPTAPIAAPSGLKKTTITVTLKSPADYKGLLNFLHYIEQNLTKLKIANITLTKSGADMVNTDMLSLEVYLR